jgi:hypothetical protein
MSDPDDLPDLHSQAERSVLMDGAVEAAGEFLAAAVGGDEPILVARLWRDLAIRELAAVFPEDGTFDDELARELNEALAARGVPYRLTKGVA